MVTRGVLDWEMLFKGAVLSLGYLALAVWFFMAMFEHRRRGGLQGLD